MLQKISTVCLLSLLSLLSIDLICAPNARAESEASLQASSQASFGGASSEATRGGHSEATWGEASSQASWGGWSSEASSESGFRGMRNRYGGYGRRRRFYGGYGGSGWNNPSQYDQQQQQTYNATINRLKNDQAQQEKHERDLSSMPDSAFVKTYGGVSASTPGGVIDTHRRLNSQY